MGAASVTGKGAGEARKRSAGELAAISNGPSLIFTGIAEAETLTTSPPSDAHSNTVSFPYALAGGENNYVILLTSINAGYVYVSDRDEDDDGNLTGFSFISEADGSVMYMVARVGSKPNLV